MNMRTIRENKGKRQSDVARETGISIARLSAIEGGYEFIGRKSAAKIAAALGVDVGDIFPHLAAQKNSGTVGDPSACQAEAVPHG